MDATRMALIRKLEAALLDEHKAVAIYGQFAQEAADPGVKDLLLHIREEELHHVEELEDMISRLSS